MESCIPLKTTMVSLCRNRNMLILSGEDHLISELDNKSMYKLIVNDKGFPIPNFTV